LERGDRVAATLRTPARLDDLAEMYGERLWRARLDVRDPLDVRSVVGQAFEDLDRIDVAVSNAGIGVYGAAEELSDDQIDQVISTNLTGSIHFARAVVPHLRAQGGGRLLQLSSMGGAVAFPGFSLYHASKWGIEGFIEALAQEIRPFGIEVTLVEPGVVETPFYASAPSTPVIDAYADNPEIVRGDIPPEEMPGDAEKVVRAMIELGEEEDPPARLLLGVDAYTHVTAAWRERLRAAEVTSDRSLGAVRDDWVAPDRA